MEFQSELLTTYLIVLYAHIIVVSSFN